MNTNIMQGKRGLIMGVANKNSIAWGIAQACADAGAELAFTYQGENLERRVRPLAESVNSSLIEACDVTDEDSMTALFDKLAKQWGQIDFVVHAIAFAGKEELMGRYVDTSSQAFNQGAEYFLLLFHRGGTPCRKTDERGRLNANPVLLWRGEGYSTL